MTIRYSLALLIFVASCAPPSKTADMATSTSTGAECFSTSFITGYEVAGDNMIRVEVGVDQRYDIIFSGGRCDQLDWSQRLAIETHATSQLCVGKQLGQGELAFRDPVSRRRIKCHIDEVKVAAAER
jgi:hypothetical protein